MNIARYTDRDYSTKIARITAISSMFDLELEQRTRLIVEEVRKNGDHAIIQATEQFDKVTLKASQFAVSAEEISKSFLQVSSSLRKAVKAVSRNVEDFSRKALRKDWSMKNRQWAIVGEKFDPLQRVGVYVPGGQAPLISTAIMTVTLAKVAGCSEIVVCTPCKPSREINPALLYALSTAGATEIYKIGGAQAIAAMAFGTKTIIPVQKIFGPGNAYVVTAKRLVFGRVGVDLLPGPSEGLILADDTAKPAWIAADMLAQAEHGSGQERVWLLTTSQNVLNSVEKEIKKQLRKLPRREAILRSLKANGWLVLVENMKEAISLINKIAPEHCEIMTRQSEKVSKGIQTAGAIFLGGYSPTAAGDYLAGPSHELPTGGAGRGFGGLTVDQFQRRTSLVKFKRKSLSKSVQHISVLAAMEGLQAHSRSVSIRNS